MNIINNLTELKEEYDFIIVGTGLAGATFANLSTAGNKILMIDRRDHIAGNVYTERTHNVDVHMYGAHIFHTNDDFVWDYLNNFTDFNDYKHVVLSKSGEQLFQMPFNNLTLMQVFGGRNFSTVKQIIASEIESENLPNVLTNLEQQAISMVGRTVYERLIKGYTEKQWGRPCTELPPDIIKRIPVRDNIDNTYFNEAKYQGIPTEGYTNMVEKMITHDNIDIILGLDFLTEIPYFESILSDNGKIVYTGAIDELFDYKYGELEYRSLDLRHNTYCTDNHIGTSVINNVDKEIPWTRQIEHVHFNPRPTDYTTVTTEYPQEHIVGKTQPYYPIGQKHNNDLYEKYRVEAEKLNYVLLGRLATYQYLDMDKVVRQVIEEICKEPIKKMI